MMKFKSDMFFLLFIIWIFFINAGYAQQGGPKEFDRQQNSRQKSIEFFQKNEKDSLINWQERIMLHIDKTVVSEETPLFFKAYLVTGPKRIRFSASNVLILELVDDEGKILTTQYHKIESGTSQGTFIIPKELKSESFLLRAYTRWMQNYGKSNFFTKRLFLSELDKKGDSSYAANISFHPEGGELLNGLTNRMVIRATTRNNRPADLIGKIVNEKGSFSTPISQYDKGLFSVLFKPEPGEIYKLKTSDGRSFALPESANEGFSLGVNNLNPSKLTVHIESVNTSENHEFFLKGEMSGVVYFNEKLTLAESPLKRDILKKDMPTGILRISLLDNEKEWASRFIRVVGKNKLDIKVVPLAGNRKLNEVAFKVSVKDSDGDPLSIELSLGVRDFSGKSEPEDFDSWEEAKRLGQPNIYDRNERFLNDLRLLTLNEGTSSFDLKRFPANIKFPFQKGLELYGHAYDLNNNLLKNTKIQVIAGSEDDFVVKEVNTDANGILRLIDLQFVGETQFIFRTSGDDTKSRLVKFKPIKTSFANTAEAVEEVKPKKKRVIEPSHWQPIDSTGLIELDEVKVNDKRIPRKSTNSIYGVEPSRAVYQNPEKPKTIPQLFLNIPGVQVTGLGGLNPRINLPRAAGRGPVLWVLDGQPLTQPTSLVEIMNTISSADVERIEILFGPLAAVYGTRAAGGAILVYTRTGNTDYITRKEAQLMFQGFHESSDFDVYREELAKKSKRRKKEELTLYWNPNLKTDENGEAVVRFKSLIEVEKIEVKASTITENGKIGRARAVF